MNLSRIIHFTLTLFAFLLALSAPARAFDSIAHEAITYHAFRHLETHRHHSSSTLRWTRLLGRDYRFMQDLLARATVDADYRDDIWAEGAFLSPFTGASDGARSPRFTGFMHFVNVTAPGKLWDFDGYNYETSSRHGIDAYLAYPTFAPRGDLSAPLGGRHPDRAAHGIEPGPMRLGFKGTQAAWEKNFDRDTPMSEVVFPPADVVAQVNFDAMMGSEPSAATFTESWQGSSPLVTGPFSTNQRLRYFWRGEVRGMPQAIDLLGTAFHLAQDVAIPQHAQGTSDNCHQELESLADRLTCATAEDPDMSSYSEGLFGSETPDCGHLYDPALTERLRVELRLEPAGAQGLQATRELLQAIARRSSAWSWSLDPNDGSVRTRLPDGRTIQAESCQAITRSREIREQLATQYNLAVAATVTLFESAARGYEFSRNGLVLRKKLSLRATAANPVQ